MIILKNPDSDKEHEKTMILQKYILIFSAIFAFTFVSFAEENETTECLCLPSEEAVFISYEHLPEFPGGHQALMKFLSENIQYPEEAKESKIQGRVFVQFTINEIGKICNVKVVRSVSPELDQEAIRVVKLMPDWIPARNRGQNICMPFTMPINFSLEEKAQKRRFFRRR